MIALFVFLYGLLSPLIWLVVGAATDDNWVNATQAGAVPALIAVVILFLLEWLTDSFGNALGAGLVWASIPFGALSWASGGNGFLTFVITLAIGLAIRGLTALSRRNAAW